MKPPGRFVDGTSNFKTDAIKSHNESSLHIKSKGTFDIKHGKSSTGTVYTSHTGEVVSESTMQPGSSGLHTTKPGVIGPIDVAIQKLNEDRFRH